MVEDIFEGDCFWAKEIQAVLEMSATEWNERYAEGETPWEKGRAHPEMEFFIEKHEVLFRAAKSILVPGCGYGHDAAVLGQLGGEVTGLDIADEPVEKAKEGYPATNLNWVKGDLFEWQGSYDLVWEHTCFCAMVPEVRSQYAKTMSRLVKPGGVYAGIFFLNPDHDPNAGPPWRVSREELLALFGEDFVLEWDEETQTSFEGREKREASMVWRRQ